MPKFEFKEIDLIKDKEGIIVAPITYCEKPKGGKLFSFSIMKLFQEEPGTEKRPPWLPRRHIDAARLLLDEVEQRLLLEEEKNRVTHR